MGADSVLVNAAYKLGQSNVPGDYSDIFNKQYEGLIAYNKARYKTIGDAFKGVGEQVEKINTSIDNRKKADIIADNLLFNETYETTATNVADAKMKKSNKQFEEGSPQNMAHVNAANTKFEDIKSQLSVLSNKNFLSKADKKLQAELRGKADKMKKNLVKAKGTVITNAAAYSEGHINNDLSFKGSPDEQLLFAQIHDPDADLEALGVRVYWDDNEELQYEYTPNRLQKEYEQNKRKEAGEVHSPVLGEFAPGNTKTISATKLTSMMRLKDVKANADANALLAKAGTHASEVIGKTKTLAHTSFDRVGASIYNDYKSLFFSGKTDIQDLTTREILVGNTNRTYKDDIGSNGGIDEAIINQLGIGSDVFTAKELADGKIDANELAKYEGAKAEIIEKLTNPQTQSEREVAASELARYWTSHAKAEFDYIKKQNKPKEAVKTNPRGGNEKIYLGMGKMNDSSLYLPKGTVNDKYNKIASLTKKGEIGVVPGWEGSNTTRYVKLGENDDFFVYQTFDPKTGEFQTKEVKGEAVRLNVNELLDDMNFPSEYGRSKSSKKSSTKSKSGKTADDWLK